MRDFVQRGAARGCAAAALLLASGFADVAEAHNTTLGGVDLEWKLVGNYALAVRTENQSEDLINGPVDPLHVDLSPEAIQRGQAFGHTGLRTTMNFDDGDRNFDKWSIVHNRLSLFAEAHAAIPHFGAHVSGDGFLDDAYRRSNDNDSPDTVNKTGGHNTFSHDARIFDGGRARVLEAYIYTDWDLFETMSLNVRAGEHVVAWGESLFLSGIMLAQGRADATRAYVPGAEIKEILLPVNQISVSFAPIPEINMLGYYHLEFRHTEIFPIGDYLAIQDLVGPGAEFTYGSVNPLYLENCVGVFTSILQEVGVPDDLALPVGQEAESLCDLGGAGGTVFNAPPYIKVYRGDDIRPHISGQWGTGIKWQVTPVTNIGFYYLNYHDSNPSVTLKTGYATIGYLPNGRPLRTDLFNQTVPITYHITYADDIKLYGMSYSTVMGAFNVAGEVLYRDNVPTSGRARVSQLITPWGTRGRIGQVLVSGIYVGNPKMIYDSFIFVAEAGWFHLFGMDPVTSPTDCEPPGPDTGCGVEPIGGGVVPFYDRDAAGFQFLAFATKNNIVSGWDLKNQIAYGDLTYGTPSLTAAFGALYAKGDRRLGVSASMTYLQNLEIALAYNFFFGSTSANINDSELQLRAHPYADRDYASINVKYNF
jgi:hypothetical protein